MQGLTIHLFKSSYDPFVELLKAHGIEHRARMPVPGVVMASGLSVELVGAIGLAAGAVLRPLAGVVTEYLKAKQSREVTINLRDGGSVHAKALAPEELQEALALAANLIAFDPKPPAKAVEQASGAVTDDDPGPG